MTTIERKPFKDSKAYRDFKLGAEEVARMGGLSGVYAPLVDWAKEDAQGIWAIEHEGECVGCGNQIVDFKAYLPPICSSCRGCLDG